MAANLLAREASSSDGPAGGGGGGGGGSTADGGGVGEAEACLPYVAPLSSGGARTLGHRVW